VVTSCNELELFDVSGCDLVSNATVQAALDSVKLRPGNIKLKLVVGGELNYSVDISIFLHVSKDTGLLVLNEIHKNSDCWVSEEDTCILTH